MYMIDDTLFFQVESLHKGPMMILVLLLAFVASALAGSVCPPREDIYPCSCVAIPQGKKIFHTTVSCHRMETTDSLNYIFSALRTMAIDRFYLYDSFWEASKLETAQDKIENKQVLPTDWFTLLKVKEMEIVDTTLSPCFACQARVFCRNGVTTRFTAVNSSSHEKICTVCDNGGKKHSWIGCLNNLKEFHFRHSGLTVIRSDFFQDKMVKLEELDFSYNRIAKIEKGALKNVANLKVLVLAHNVLESLAGMFSDNAMNKLEKLDLSWNSLKMLSGSFFKSVPKITTLIANNNQIVYLEKDQWKDSPDTLRVVDVGENPIHCGCDIRWVNSTFHINTVITGHCATPEQYENSLIRRASRFLNELCDDDGNIGTRSRSQTAKVVTKSMNES